MKLDHACFACVSTVGLVGAVDSLSHDDWETHIRTVHSLPYETDGACPGDDRCAGRYFLVVLARTLVKDIQDRKNKEHAQ